MEKNCFTILVVVTLLSVSAQAETMGVFSGLPINKEIINEANMAVNDLKSNLNGVLSCSDPSSSLNLIGLIKKCTFRNNDQFEYQNPINLLSGITSRLFNFKSTHDRVSQVRRAIRRLAIALQNVKRQFLAYNNVIVGSNNIIQGDSNFIIGDSNNLQGNNNWALVSDVRSQAIMEGVLLIGPFLIELEDFLNDSNVPIENVIHCINKSNGKKIYGKWWGRTRSLFRLII